MYALAIYIPQPHRNFAFYAINAQTVYNELPSDAKMKPLDFNEHFTYFDDNMKWNIFETRSLMDFRNDLLIETYWHVLCFDREGGWINSWHYKIFKFGTYLIFRAFITAKEWYLYVYRTSNYYNFKLRRRKK